MDSDLILAVGLFVIVVALAVMRAGSVDQTILLVAGALAVFGRDRVSGFRAGKVETLPVHRLAEAGFDPELTGGQDERPPPKSTRETLATPATPYLGAVDGPPLDDTCAAPAWSGLAPDEGDLQADELHVRQVRARDQLPVRQQTGIYKRLQLVGGAVEEELRAEEDSVWWERSDS
jgi:hypothetical protein